MKMLTVRKSLLLIATTTIFSWQNRGDRKISGTHFHALEWNSFGTPAPANEITGLVPKAGSDSEEEATMLAELKKDNVVKAITSVVPPPSQRI